MFRKTLIWIFILGAAAARGQVISFTYDSAGNRNKRVLTTPPPVNRMINLTAEKRESSTLLHWNLDDITNIEICEIQRSTNQEGWTNIGRFDGIHVSSNFSFLDNEPASGNNKYRIMLVTDDNKTIYSLQKSINFESINIYPNPVKERLNIKISAPSAVSIISKEGKVVFESSLVPSDGIDVSQFSPGVYIIRLNSTSGKSISSKFLKEN